MGQTPIRLAARFPSGDQASVIGISIALMTCPSCGLENTGRTLCSGCGASLEGHALLTRADQPEAPTSDSTPAKAGTVGLVCPGCSEKLNWGDSNCAACKKAICRGLPVWLDNPYHADSSTDRGYYPVHRNHSLLAVQQAIANIDRRRDCEPRVFRLESGSGWGLCLSKTTAILWNEYGRCEGRRLGR